MLRILTAIGLVAATACAPTMQTAAMDSRDCFYADNVSGWRVIDDDTIAVSVGANRNYALETFSDADQLRWDMAIKLESDTGFICTGDGPTGVEVHGLDPNFHRTWLVTDVARLPDDYYARS